VIGQKNDWMERLLGWWYRFTTPPRPAEEASFAQRETERRARMLSTVGFFLVVILLALLPTTFINTSSALPASLILQIVVIGALMANRAGKTMLAGMMIVTIAEVVLIAVLLQPPYTPLTPAVFQEYNFFFLIELLAVSLLPTYSIFVLATVNSVFIASHLLFAVQTGAYTPDMAHSLGANLLLTLSVPVALQFFIAGVVSLWVYTAAKSNERANRAEMVAALEHTIAEQNTAAEREKQELEESIQQLIKAHTDAVNGKGNARIAYPPAKVLWPLVGIVNSLWVRLQRAQQIEKELQQVQQRLQQSEKELQQLRQRPQRSENEPQSQWRRTID